MRGLAAMLVHLSAVAVTIDMRRRVIGTKPLTNSGE